MTTVTESSVKPRTEVLRPVDPIGYGRIYLPPLRPTEDWAKPAITIGDAGTPTVSTPGLEEVAQLLRDAVGDPWLTAKPDYNREQARARYTIRYSYALADPRAVELLCEYGPWIEIEARNGWWSRLVQQGGGEMIAYAAPTARGTLRVKAVTWTLVKEVDAADAASQHPDQGLFAVLTPDNVENVLRGVRAYSGERLALARRTDTSAETFETEVLASVLDDGWEEVETHRLPSWEGTETQLAIYQRNFRTKTRKSPSSKADAETLKNSPG